MNLHRGSLLGRLAVGTTGVVLVVLTVSAVHAGTASPGHVGTTSPQATDPSQPTLTATNGTNKITFADGHALTLNVTATDGTWSINGSRLAFVDSTGGIRTVRFNDQGDIGLYVKADGSPRSDLSWAGASTFMWSSHVTDPATHVASDVIQYASVNGGPIETVPLPSGTNWTHITGDGNYYVQGQQGGNPSSIYRFSWFPGQADPVVPTLLVTGAANPADLDDEEYAFTKDDASGHAQVWVGARGNTVGFPIQITSDPVDHTNVRADGTDGTIAFNEGDAVYTAQVLGSTATTPKIVPGLNGVAAFQHPTPTNVLREAGSNRYQTAVAISQNTWSPPAGDEQRLNASSVVLTRGDTFADALGASALAAAKSGPLLLTPSTSLDPNTAKEIARILTAAQTVYIVGGTGAISTSVENQVKALGVKTQRIAGADRYDTAVQVARQISPTPGLVLLATGLNFPDALSAGAVAGSFDGPNTQPADNAVVVLSADNSLPAVTGKYLAGLESSATKPVFVGVGGSATNALASAGLPDSFGVVGKDRYETAVLMAKSLFPGAYTYGVATGGNWPDALAGSAMLGVVGAPLLLTNPTTVNPTVLSYVDFNSGSFLRSSFVFGQTDVVSDAVIRAYATASGAGTPELLGSAQSSTAGSPAGARQPAKLASTLSAATSSGYLKPLS